MPRRWTPMPRRWRPSKEDRVKTLYSLGACRRKFAVLRLLYPNLPRRLDESHCKRAERHTMAEDAASNPQDHRTRHSRNLRCSVKRPDHNECSPKEVVGNVVGLQVLATAEGFITCRANGGGATLRFKPTIHMKNNLATRISVHIQRKPMGTKIR